MSRMKGPRCTLANASREALTDASAENKRVTPGIKKANTSTATTAPPIHKNFFLGLDLTSTRRSWAEVSRIMVQSLAADSAAHDHELQSACQCAEDQLDPFIQSLICVTQQ